MQHRSPLAAGAQYVEDRVENRAQRILPGLSCFAWCGQPRLDPLPFFVCQITWIGRIFHTPKLSTPLLFRQFLSKPVRYCRRVWALGPWVKYTRNGARNSASSGKGIRRAWGNRAHLLFLVIILTDYHRFMDFDKVVLGQQHATR